MIKVYLLLLSFAIIQCSTTSNKKIAEKSKQEDLDFFTDEEIKAIQDPYAEKHGKKQTSNLEGYASWYGKELHNRPTASGEIFDMHQYTAAHKTLPFGSLVLVTNKENDKKQLVRINDRGPFVEGRVIDVSYATAKELGFSHKGVVPVALEVIEKGNNNILSKNKLPPSTDNRSKTEINPAENKIVIREQGTLHDKNLSNFIFFKNQKPQGYTVQLGAFKVKNNAIKYKEFLESQYNQQSFVASSTKWNYVLMGDFSAKKEAKKFYKRLKQDGFEVLYKGKISSISQ